MSKAWTVGYNDWVVEVRYLDGTWRHYDAPCFSLCAAEELYAHAVAASERVDVQREVRIIERDIVRKERVVK